jgi:hypothetical protein
LTWASEEDACSGALHVFDETPWPPLFISTLLIHSANDGCAFVTVAVSYWSQQVLGVYLEPARAMSAMWVLPIMIPPYWNTRTGWIRLSVLVAPSASAPSLHTHSRFH